MTNQEEKEVIRVCGENYEESDIPAYMRKRDREILLKSISYNNELLDKTIKVIKGNNPIKL
jgi:hypothetical protein